MDLDDILARIAIVSTLVLLALAFRLVVFSPCYEKISFDNHDYIRIKGSVIHSPDCKCQQKQTESQGGE